MPSLIDVDVDEMNKGFKALFGFPCTMMNSTSDQSEYPIEFYAQYLI